EPHGAIFRVALPAAPAAAVVAAATRRRDEVRRGQGTVLVVDDEPMVRSTLRRALRDLGYEVVEAVDGVAALEQLAAGTRVNAVLLDCVMPRKGGRETLNEIRRGDG